MERINFKTIMDRTFMLLDQAINEKRAEHGVQKFKRKSYDTAEELPEKTARSASIKPEKK